MSKAPITYAFIDSQNVNLAVQEMGWKLDFARFRVYLSEKFQVSKAYIFIGYMPSNQELYSFLQDAGYHCIFRPTLTYKDGSTKGNCDAELVLQAMIDLAAYDTAVIVTGDGDFYCLLRHLADNGKLKALLVPNRHKYSALLKLKEFKAFTRDMNDLRTKLSYRGLPNKKKSPHKDKTLQGTSSIGNAVSVPKNRDGVNKRAGSPGRILSSAPRGGTAQHMAKKPQKNKRTGI